MAAFQRQYDNDHSWEDLQEDEFGRLLSLVLPFVHSSLLGFQESGPVIYLASCACHCRLTYKVPNLEKYKRKHERLLQEWLLHRD